MHNIVTLQDTQVVYNETLLNFVRSVAGSYPNYQFRFTASSEAVVTCDSEAIGRLSVASVRDKGYNYRDAVTLTNKKIRNGRIRSGPMKTKDLKKAAKLFAQYFTPQESESLMDDTNAEVDTTIRRLCNNRNTEATTKFQSCIQGKSLAKLVEALEGIIDLSELQTTVETTAILMTHGVTVVQRGNRYLVQHRKDRPATLTSKGAVQEFTADTLPYNLRASLAMMKLVNDGTVVANRGLRVNSNVFIVMEDNNG